MSVHNFIPANLENVGYKVFPLPDKSIRLDDPNYIHYERTEPVYGDRFESDRKDSTGSYNAPLIDDRTILRTHTSVSSSRWSYSGSLPPASPQKSAPSPSKEKDVTAAFQTTESHRSSLPTHAFSRSSTGGTPPVSPKRNSIEPLQASVIRQEDSNLVEHFHTFNSVDDYGSVDSPAEKEAGENGKNDDDEDGYAVIPPRDQRVQHHFGENGEEKAMFGESEYDVAVGPLSNVARMADANDKSETTTHTSTLTFTPTISEEEFPTNQGSIDVVKVEGYCDEMADLVLAEAKKNSLPSSTFEEELKQVTSSRGAAIQLKDEVISKKEQEVETERQKAKIDFTAEKFLHEIPCTDVNGVDLTEAQRFELAQQLANKLRAEREAELEAEFEEWKRVNDIEIPCAVRRNSSPLNK